MNRNTDELLRCIALDTMPGLACRVDFGIEGPDEVSKFGALQWVVRHGLVTEQELDTALGNGPALTQLVGRGANPYACTIVTAWDGLEEPE